MLENVLHVGQVVDYYTGYSTAVHVAILNCPKRRSLRELRVILNPTLTLRCRWANGTSCASALGNVDACLPPCPHSDSCFRPITSHRKITQIRSALIILFHLQVRYPCLYDVTAVLFACSRDGFFNEFQENNNKKWPGSSKQGRRPRRRHGPSLAMQGGGVKRAPRRLAGRRSRSLGQTHRRGDDAG